MNLATKPTYGPRAGLRTAGQILLALVAVAAWAATAAATPPLPMKGTFSAADRARVEIQTVVPFEEATRNCISTDDTSHQARGGSDGTDDSAHYARGSVCIVLVFVNHDGGTWDAAERAEQGVKSYDAKQFFLDYMPSQGFLTFDHEESTTFYYYNPTVNYDISAAGDFTESMIEDAADAIGFSDSDGDGWIVDDMNQFLQGSLGGWDNVISVFIPADYTFAPAQAGWVRGWAKLSRNMSWGTWAHEWGHCFGACDEGGGPAGCNNIECNDVCMSYFLVDQVPNGNCQYCATGVDCIMRGYVNVPPCEYTYRNWGWVDDNGNGLLDNTRNWDPDAAALYDIWELYHNGWLIHTNETWGFVANQKWESWGAIGVRSRGSSDWAVRVYGENNREHFLASDWLSPNVKFVVGDFNHNNLGQDHIRLTNIGGAGQYVLSYETGSQTIYPDGVERNYSWDDKNVVRAFDLPLFAGETIQVQLNIDTAGLDMGMALFKSNGDTYYAPRTSSVWEADSWPAGISESYTFDVPDDDVYGLIVWSNNEIDGDFSIKVGPSLVALTEASPFTSFFDLRLYSYAPYTNYWAVSAVRPGDSSNAKLSLFQESTFQTHLQTSGAYPNVEFIAADYNPSTSTDYLRVNRQSGVSGHTTEWEQGADLLVGLEDHDWESGQVAKIWDTYLLEGQEYRIQRYGSVFLPINAKTFLFSSADGDRYKSRSAAEVGAGSLAGEWFTYTPPQDDFYGVVVMVDDDTEGPYTIGVGPYVVLDEQVPVEFPDEVIWADYQTEVGSWTVAGVRPEIGSSARFSIWECEDRDITCYLDGDLSGGQVRYVVVDGNHTPAQTYYARVSRTSGLGAQEVSFDVASDNDISFDDPGELESVTATFADGEPVQVWDLNIAAAPIQTTVTVIPRSGDMDLGVAIFSSSGGNYIQSPDEAVTSANDDGPGLQEEVTFHASMGDIYGLVVTNESGTAGQYDIYIRDATVVDVEDGPQNSDPTALDLRAINNASARPVLELALPEKSAVQLGLYDVTGRQVRVLSDGSLQAGVHTLEWDGRRDNGEDAGAGVYFAKLRALGEERTLKVLRTR